MENHPTSSSPAYQFNDFPDLNLEDEVENNLSCNEQPLGEQSTHDEEAKAANEVACINLTIGEMETRLAPGQFVENEHIAHALYCKYACAKGFSARKDKAVWFKDGSGIQGKFFVCSNEGGKDNKRSKNKVPIYQKTTSRCGCKALLKITRTKDGPWKVTRFDKEHNHELYAVDQTYLLRSSRHLTDDQQLIITSMLKSGVPAAKSIRVLENVAQGRENVGFLPCDVYDFIRKSKVENGDSLALVNHLKNRSNQEPEFYWNMEVDDDNRLMNFFFRDYRSLNDYLCFGDVLSVDTTYRTNRYELICTPFVGINHHNENVMFGFAFMSYETEKSFEWLFRTFLESMGDRQPGIIFTDQCQAMMNAIGTVFPEAHHRLCQWHINQNAPSHFGSLKDVDEFKSLWTKCMNHCETQEEFEATWIKMMTDFDVGDNKSWFNTMYNLRHKWAAVFSNHIFSAGLLATSRSEGTNSALKKKFGNKTSSLFDCVVDYDDIQSQWRLSEKEKDTLCHHNKPSLFVPHNPLLKHASNVYTFNIFKFFEKELRDTMSFKIPQQISYDGASLTLYIVKSYGDKLRCRTVEYDSEHMEIRCSCHKFEVFGILCSHALKVFELIDMQCIPEKYVKKRWTKIAKIGMWNGQSGDASWKRANVGDSSYVSKMAFLTNLSREFHNIGMQAKEHEETRAILSQLVEDAKRQIEVWFRNMNLNDSIPPDGAMGKDSNNLDEVLVRDPLIAKGRGITNGFKRHWENKSKKGKGKAKSSRRTTKSAKQKDQNSRGEDIFPLRDTSNVQKSQHFQEMLFQSQYDQFFHMEHNNQDGRPRGGYY